MVEWGEKLSEVDRDALQARLRAETDGKAAKRLVVALEYKHNTPIGEVQSKYGIPRATAYDWLDRFEARTLDDALYDESPSGRRRRLSDDQVAELKQLLRTPPHRFGYEGNAWSPSLVRTLVFDEFNVEYSLRHVYRLLDEVDEPEEIG